MNGLRLHRTSAADARLFTMAIRADDEQYVERPAPGAAPTAFRMWAAGENRSDEGSIFFTQESADRLMAEQEARGRLYSSDFDHLSVLPNRPAASGRASGWHRLELRDGDGGPDLWVVGIDWCQDVKAGLEARPPLWRYFSPAFKTDEQFVVTSYINFALCINPKTHDLPSLASIVAHKESSMLTKAELMAAYAKICAADSSEDEKKDAHAKLAAHFAAMPDEGGEKPPVDGNEPPPAKTEKVAEVVPPEKTEKDEKEHAMAMLLDDKRQRDIQALLDGRTDIAESEHAWAITQPIEVVRGFLKSRPKQEINIKAALDGRPELSPSERAWAEKQSGVVVLSFLAARPKTLGSRPITPTLGPGDAHRPGLQGAELEQLHAEMGIRPPVTQQFERTTEGGIRIHNVGPRKARELAAKAAGGQGK